MSERRYDEDDVRDEGPSAQHNHITRDIKPEGWGCPACDHYHEMERTRG